MTLTLGLAEAIKCKYLSPNPAKDGTLYHLPILCWDFYLATDLHRSGVDFRTELICATGDVCIETSSAIVIHCL